MQSPTRHAAIFHWAVALLGTGFMYFGVEICVLAVESRCTPAAHGLDCLSSTVVRTERDIMQSSDKVIADDNDGPKWQQCSVLYRFNVG